MIYVKKSKKEDVQLGQLQKRYNTPSTMLRKLKKLNPLLILARQ